MFYRGDFDEGKGDKASTACCAKCTGKTLWCGDGQKIRENCRICLEETDINDYGVLKECHKCSCVVIPQSFMKTVVC